MRGLRIVWEPPFLRHFVVELTPRPGRRARLQIVALDRGRADHFDIATGANGTRVEVEAVV